MSRSSFDPPPVKMDSGAGSATIPVSTNDESVLAKMLDQSSPAAAWSRTLASSSKSPLSSGAASAQGAAVSRAAANRPADPAASAEFRRLSQRCARAGHARNETRDASLGPHGARCVAATGSPGPSLRTSRAALPARYRVPRKDDSIRPRDATTQPPPPTPHPAITPTGWPGRAGPDGLARTGWSRGPDTPPRALLLLPTSRQPLRYSKEDQASHARFECAGTCPRERGRADCG